MRGFECARAFIIQMPTLFSRKIDVGPNVYSASVGPVGVSHKSPIPYSFLQAYQLEWWREKHFNNYVIMGGKAGPDCHLSECENSCLVQRTFISDGPSTIYHVPIFDVFFRMYIQCQSVNPEMEPIGSANPRASFLT